MVPRPSSLLALALAALTGLGGTPVPAQDPAPTRQVVTPEGARVRTVVNGRAELVEHLGRKALTLVPAAETAGKDLDMLALLDTPAFRDGTLELELSGAPRADAPADSRGFVGLAFRTDEHGEGSEVVYLRPTNARCDDQVRRNRSVQYVSHPEYPWHRLRQESPGKYESYVDLVPGQWTTLRLEVAGTSARLYIDGAAQPCLVVTDLKRGAVEGGIALWAHVETEAYFGTLTVTPRAP